MNTLWNSCSIEILKFAYSVPCQKQIFMHNHRWELRAGNLSLVYHYYILIGMDGCLPAGFHKKKKRAKVISLQITAHLVIRITSQIIGIFGTYSSKLNWLYLINFRVFKKKIRYSKKPKSGMWKRGEFTSPLYQFLGNSPESLPTWAKKGNLTLTFQKQAHSLWILPILEMFVLTKFILFALKHVFSIFILFP